MFLTVLFTNKGRQQILYFNDEKEDAINQAREQINKHYLQGFFQRVDTLEEESFGDNALTYEFRCIYRDEQEPNCIVAIYDEEKMVEDIKNTCYERGLMEINGAKKVHRAFSLRPDDKEYYEPINVSMRTDDEGEYQYDVECIYYPEPDDRLTYVENIEECDFNILLEVYLHGDLMPKKVKKSDEK